MSFKELFVGNFYIYTIDKEKVVRFPLSISPDGEAKVINTPNGVDYSGNITLNNSFAILTLTSHINSQSKTNIFLNIIEFNKKIEFIIGVYTTIGKLFIERPDLNFISSGRILIQKTNDTNFVIGIDNYEPPKKYLNY